MGSPNVAKWCADLRSGRFTQCFGSLSKIYDDGKTCHCVMGVACESMGVEKHKYYDGTCYTYGKSGFTATPPSEVYDKLGIPLLAKFSLKKGMPHYERLIGKDHTRSVVGLNDGWEFSFEEIADIIQYVDDNNLWEGKV